MRLIVNNNNNKIKRCVEGFLFALVALYAFHMYVCIQIYKIFYARELFITTMKTRQDPSQMQNESEIRSLNYLFKNFFSFLRYILP